jgi:hypothetical protein
MSVAPFDTLAFARRLEEGGFSVEQSRTAASALADALTDEMVTRADLERFEGLIHRDLEAFKAEMREEMNAFKAEMRAEIGALRSDMKAQEQRITLRLGSMLVVATGLLLAANILT